MASSRKISFGTLLKQHRTAAGLSQETLASRARMSRNFVGLLENGQRNPSLRTFLIFCKVMKIKDERDLLPRG